MKENTKFDEKEINEWFDEFNKVRIAVKIQQPVLSGEQSLN